MLSACLTLFLCWDLCLWVSRVKTRLLPPSMGTSYPRHDIIVFLLYYIPKDVPRESVQFGRQASYVDTDTTPRWVWTLGEPHKNCRNRSDDICRSRKLQVWFYQRMLAEWCCYAFLFLIYGVEYGGWTTSGRKSFLVKRTKSIRYLRMHGYLELVWCYINFNPPHPA